ncbi:hypothetical protein [Rhodobacter sp. SY28-1]|uniref:hypothetical protein n=1 Tax=Rhodobacter sp. SY28-1 TaxID=2562317 RepID=UPI0010C04D68|nr:hypothetical protein [Rhodobacter sp. SY28-1]
MPQTLALANHRPARISKKFRAVLRLHEIEGMSVTDACAKVGYSRAAYYKARKAPDVQELIRELRRELVETAEAKKAYLKVKALEVGLDLMLNAKNETIRARMVEFLGSDAKVSPVSVHVDARQVEVPSGYRYIRPQQMIDSRTSDKAAGV